MEPRKLKSKTARKTQFQQPSLLLRKVQKTVFAGRGYKPLPLPQVQHRLHTPPPEGFGVKRFVLAIFVAITLCGCNVFLPSGTAPEGRISDNTYGEKPLSAEELENHAATSLTAYILMDNSVSTLCCTDSASKRLFVKVSSVTGSAQEQSSRFRLSFANNTFVLTENGKLLWQYPQR